MIDQVQFSTGAAAGADGTATATGYSPVLQGRVVAVHVAYQGSPPATTDFMLVDEADSAGEAILSLPNNAVDGKYYPRRPVQDNTGTNLSSQYAPYGVHGRLQGSLAQANAGDAAVVTVWVEQ